jgi:hypothetical protein
MHGLVALFPGVFALAIILLVIGLVALCILVIMSSMIMASTILMTIVRLAIIVVVAVASIVIMVFTALRSKKMSCSYFLWLLLILGNLLKNASRLVGCLTLLKESNHLEQVGWHHLVQVGKLVLVRFRLRKEDLLTLLLRRGYVHHLTEVATLKVAEKLHLMPRELVHWHECRLLGHTKPADQLVAYI